MNDNSATIADRAFPSEWITCPSPFLDGREKRVDRLLYGLFHHQRIQLLSGPAGAGKSIALRRLEKRLRDRLLTLFVDANDTHGQDALLRLIGDATGSHFDAADSSNGNATSKLTTISRRLQQLADDGQRVLLLVDNAEQLDADSLSSLLQLARTRQPATPAALGIVLACLPEFTAEHTDRRHWEPVLLKPLSVAGTARYLQDRLSRAGIRGYGPLNRAMVEDIHAQSGGWPGNIDQQARKRLGDINRHLLNTRMGRRRSPASLVILFALAIIAALAWHNREPQRELNSATGIDTRQSSTTDNRGKPRATARVTTSPGTQSAAHNADLTTNSRPGAIHRTPVAPPTAHVGAETHTGPHTTATAPAAAQKTTPPHRATQPGSPPAPPAAQPPPASAVAPTASAPTPAAKPAPSTHRGSIVHRQNWIQQQPPGHWTLQAFTAHSESHLLNLITRSGINGDWAYYHIRQNNKDWYTLLYGSFASRNAALQASTTLKPLFGKPLLRNYRSIHKSLGIRP